MSVLSLCCCFSFEPPVPVSGGRSLWGHARSRDAILHGVWDQGTVRWCEPDKGRDEPGLRGRSLKPTPSILPSISGLERSFQHPVGFLAECPRELMGRIRMPHHRVEPSRDTCHLDPLPR